MKSWNLYIYGKRDGESWGASGATYRLRWYYDFGNGGNYGGDGDSGHAESKWEAYTNADAQLDVDLPFTVLEREP